MSPGLCPSLSFLRLFLLLCPAVFRKDRRDTSTQLEPLKLLLAGSVGMRLLKLGKLLPELVDLEALVRLTDHCRLVGGRSRMPRKRQGRMGRRGARAQVRVECLRRPAGRSRVGRVQPLQEMRGDVRRPLEVGLRLEGLRCLSVRGERVVLQQGLLRAVGATKTQEGGSCASSRAGGCSGRGAPALPCGHQVAHELSTAPALWHRGMESRE